MNSHPVPALIEPTFKLSEVHQIVQQEVAKSIREERRRNRHVNRWIWLISMAITVAVAACLRRQKFTPELDWYWIPMIAVPVNGFCCWLGNKMYFGNWK